MAKQPKEKAGIIHIPKRTSIGNGKVKMSSMNKHKRRNYKKYNRQGKKCQTIINIQTMSELLKS